MGELKANKIKLESGRTLEVMPAPFAEAKAVYKVFAKELKSVDANEDREIDTNMYKDLLCSLLSSDDVEGALMDCMRRCKYDGHKITEDTFENDETARQDYFEICFYVAEVNVRPFFKTLMQKFGHLLGDIVNPAQA